MRLVDKFFGWSLTGSFGALILFAATFFRPGLHTLATLAIAALVLIATLRDLRWGVYAAFADLLLAGKGYWFSVPLGSDRLPLRMIIFIIVMAVWFARRARERKGILPPRGIRDRLAALLAVAAGYAALNGLIHHPFNNVFLDANAWLYFFLLPAVIKALATPKDFHRVLQLLAAGTLVLGTATLLTLWAFGHLPASILGPWYQLIRDSGMGEITPVSGTLVRVFFQSHLYALAGAMVFLALLCRRAFAGITDTITAGVVWYTAAATIVVSQSRSFWVAAAVGSLLVLAVAAFHYALRWRALLILFLLAFVVFTQQSLVALVSGNYGSGVLLQRISGLEREPAASTRRSQLAPLTAAIGQHPLLGSGFGRTVSYRTQDPRILRQQPDGWYTTFAFEWGYLDIALKLGMLGALIYAAWLTTLILTPFLARKRDPGIAGISESFAMALAAVAVANIFTPYLNHPLGIGWVLVVGACAAALLARQDGRGAMRTPRSVPHPQVANGR
ncbi:MAG: Uncharacterized protein G01um101431_149 [Parcubacteria group bacterium Gr01-1014_31]|nr:MAG: Uncharacterized protein G01um101431_149 [Parcubacteria group bacterium Gr01-1014_31]